MEIDTPLSTDPMNSNWEIHVPQTPVPAEGIAKVQLTKKTESLEAVCSGDPQSHTIRICS